jgi:hypothetical protein
MYLISSDGARIIRLSVLGGENRFISNHRNNRGSWDLPSQFYLSNLVEYIIYSKSLLALSDNSGRDEF